MHSEFKHREKLKNLIYSKSQKIKFICILSLYQPTVRSGCARCTVSNVLHSKGNDVRNDFCTKSFKQNRPLKTNALFIIHVDYCWVAGFFKSCSYCSIETKYFSYKSGHGTPITRLQASEQINEVLLYSKSKQAKSL